MPYVPYYPAGWTDSPAQTTPIVAASLQNIENGLTAASPMTNQGDTIYGAAAGVPARLPIGTQGYVLTVVNGVPVWQVSSAPSVNPAFSWTLGEALSQGELTVPRIVATNSAAPVTQKVTIMYWTAVKSEQATSVTLQTGATVASGLTYAAVAFYSIAANGNLTQVATTGDIHVGNFGATFTQYTLSLGTGFAKVAGTMYAMAVLCVGTTPPTLQCTSPGSLVWVTPWAPGNVIEAVQTATATTMPASMTFAALGANPNGSNMFQALVSPTATGSGGGGTSSTVLFFDDFVQAVNTPPSNALWNIRTGPASPNFGGGRQSYYVGTAPILYEDGTTNLIMKVGSAGTNGAPAGNYPACRLDTQGIFALQSGQSLEFKVKVTGLAGCWPANWLATENGVYPTTWFEVDIQESGDANPAQSAVTVWSGGSSQTNITAAGTGTQFYNLDANYHLYRIDYTGTQFQIFIDGVLTFTMTQASAVSMFGSGIWLWSTEGGMYIVMDIDVDEGLYGTPNAGSLPQTIMTVDYVRAWSPAGPYVP